MGALFRDGLSDIQSTRLGGGVAFGAATALERHYRPEELADSWGLSAKIIRQIFSSELGVLKVARPETRNKRGYCTLRIPESVVARVHKKLTACSR